LEFGSYQPENVESKTSDCVPFAVNEQNNEKQEQINSSEFNKVCLLFFLIQRTLHILNSRWVYNIILALAYLLNILPDKR